MPKITSAAVIQRLTDLLPTDTQPFLRFGIRDATSVVLVGEDNDPEGYQYWFKDAGVTDLSHPVWITRHDIHLTIRDTGTHLFKATTNILLLSDRDDVQAIRIEEGQTSDDWYKPSIVSVTKYGLDSAVYRLYGVSRFHHRLNTLQDSWTMGVMSLPSAEVDRLRIEAAALLDGMLLRDLSES